MYLGDINLLQMISTQWNKQWSEFDFFTIQKAWALPHAMSFMEKCHSCAPSSCAEWMMDTAQCCSGGLDGEREQPKSGNCDGAGKGKGSAVESRGELPPGWGVLEWGSSYSFLQLGGSISAAIDTHVKLIARRYFGFGCYVPVSLSCDCPFLGQHKTHWISLLSVCNVNPKYKQQQMQDLTKRARVVWCSDTSTAHPLLCHLVLSVQSVLRFPWLSHQFSQFTHISEDEFKPIWLPWGSE